MLECPQTFDTISMGTPALSSNVAPVCLAQCVVTGLLYLQPWPLQQIFETKKCNLDKLCYLL